MKRITHKGGKMPVPDRTMVHVEYRNGFDARDYASVFEWNWSDDYDADIIAYMVLTGVK